MNDGVSLEKITFDIETRSGPLHPRTFLDFTLPEAETRTETSVIFSLSLSPTHRTGKKACNRDAPLVWQSNIRGAEGYCKSGCELGAPRD